MSPKTNTTQTVVAPVVSAPVTLTDALVNTGKAGGAETPLCVVTHPQHGRIGVTLDSEFSTDSQGRTRSAYWLRFEEGKAPTQVLADAGWHTPKRDRRQGFWAFPS